LRANEQQNDATDEKPLCDRGHRQAHAPGTDALADGKQEPDGFEGHQPSHQLGIQQTPQLMPKVRKLSP